MIACVRHVYYLMLFLSIMTFITYYMVVNCCMRVIDTFHYSMHCSGYYSKVSLVLLYDNFVYLKRHYSNHDLSMLSLV